MKIFPICILAMIYLCGVTGAVLNLQMSFSNSQDELSMNMMGRNLDFDAFVELMPDKLSYKNGGSSDSNDLQSMYSYSVTFDGETLNSGTETDSGGFSWNTLALSNHDGQGSKTFSLSKKNSVLDGNLDTSYGNGNQQVNQQVQAISSAYTQAVVLTPDSIRSTGKGLTITGTGSSGDETGSTPNKGMYETLSLTTDDKSAVIQTNLAGDTNSLWLDFVSCDGQDASLGTKTQGIINGAMSDFEMRGDATGVTTQILPAGKVSIDVTTTTDLDIKAISDYINDEVDDFNNKYPEESFVTPPLWYMIHNRAFVNPIDTHSDGWPGKCLDYYRMSMRFNFRD
jgi:hypothetical protein